MVSPDYRYNIHSAIALLQSEYSQKLNSSEELCPDLNHIFDEAMAYLDILVTLNSSNVSCIFGSLYRQYPSNTTLKDLIRDQNMHMMSGMMYHIRKCAAALSGSDWEHFTIALDETMKQASAKNFSKLQAATPNIHEEYILKHIMTPAEYGLVNENAGSLKPFINSIFQKYPVSTIEEVYLYFLTQGEVCKHCESEIVALKADIGDLLAFF
jgi:hypothetical protein